MSGKGNDMKAERAERSDGEGMAPTLSTPFRHLVIRSLGYASFQNHPQPWSFATPSVTRRFSLPLRPLSSMATPRASANPPPSTPNTKTVRVVVKGRVQGVFYRNWTVDNAVELGLKGWVRNRRDGSVEALFSGDPDSVQEMEQRCRRGPPNAVVTGLSVVPCNDDPGTHFQRKPTV